MIIVRLAGGLGNQIFQLGAALICSKTFENIPIIVDESGLSRYQSARTNHLGKIFDFSKSSIPIEYAKNFITKLRIPKILPITLNKISFVSDRNFMQVTQSKLPIKILYLDGYFQDCLNQNLFEEMRDLLSVFLDQQNRNEYSQSTCVIHIRGGDFKHLGWIKVSPESYYHESIRKMIDLHSVEDFLVITDDMEYSSSIMNTFKINYEIRSSDIVSDFMTILSIKKRIISNSTFALWACSLGPNEEVITIAPKLLRPGCLRPFKLVGEE